MKHKKVKRSLPLKSLDKLKRDDLERKWLVEDHPWERTIFSDEKWFSLDGPHDWRSYVQESEEIIVPQTRIKVGVLWYGSWFYQMVFYRL